MMLSHRCTIQRVTDNVSLRTLLFAQTSAVVRGHPVILGKTHDRRVNSAESKVQRSRKRPTSNNVVKVVCIIVNV